MGRIQKKKDPVKKKVQKTERSSQDATLMSNGNSSTASKVAPVVKKPVAQTKVKAVSTEKSLLQKVVQFLLEVKIELKKVAWPSRKQTMGSTIVVIALVFIISIFLGVVDFGLSGIIRMVLP